MLQVLRYSSAGEVTCASVPATHVAGVAPNPPHSPVVVAELRPPASLEELQRRGVISLPPSLCALLACPPVLIATVSGAPLTLSDWQRLCAEAEAVVRSQVQYQERTVVPVVGRSTNAAAVADDLVKRGKKAALKKVKVKEDVEVSEEEQDDAVLELLSDEDEDEVALEDEEDVDDACDEAMSGECDDEDEEAEGDGEEECSEEECSEGGEVVVPPPAKKARGVA